VQSRGAHVHLGHKALLSEIKKHERKRVHSLANDSYLSSGHHYYDVSVPARRHLAKGWLKENRSISNKEFVAVLDSLFRGKSHEEKTLASILLAEHRTGRDAIGPKQLNAWLDHLVGWAEIDSLCQGAFKADEILSNWAGWESFIRKLSHDKNINKRRASLVFLSGPVRTSDDRRLAALALDVIEALKSERNIMITKAISWLLRSLVQHHKRIVAAYVTTNRQSLPAIAVRETTRKIATGRK
jgi:3-methyladenine DNA glycosylase AlkD